MAGRTALTPGNYNSGAYIACFVGSSADLASLASGSSVLSTSADIANQTNIDTLADVGVEFAIASTTLAAGASLLLGVFDKNTLNTSWYGDNSMGTAGTKQTYFPSYSYGGRGLYILSPTITGAAQTLVTGVFSQVVLPLRPFRFVICNNLGVALGAGTQYCQIQTFNLNLNN